MILKNIFCVWSLVPISLKKNKQSQSAITISILYDPLPPECAQILPFSKHFLSLAR